MWKIKPYLNDSRGMTLLEVLVFTLIIGIMAGVAVPTVNKAIGKFKLRNAANELRSDIRILRNTAITERKSPYISFYVEGESNPENIYVLKKNYSTTMKRVDLPDGISLKGSTFNTRLGFNPLGSTMYGGGTITLANKNGDLLYVIVAVTTGRVRIDTKPPLNWTE